MRHKNSLIVIIALVILSLLSLVASQKLSFDLSRAQAESAQNLKKSEEKVREEMIVISRQLGVTCTECHNVQDFKNGDKKTFKVGLEHIKLTEMLRENGMNGKSGRPEASCFMCHHGKLRPDYKEALPTEGKH